MALQFVEGIKLGLGKHARGKERREDRKERREERKEDRQGGGGGGPKLIETSPNLAKVKLFPLGVQTPAAGAAFTHEAIAQNMFEPIRGIAQAADAATAFGGLNFVEFTQLDIGNVSQLTVKNRRFPGQMLSPEASDIGLCDLDMLPVGLTFSMEGVNTSADAQRITIGWYGWYFQSVNLASMR